MYDIIAVSYIYSIELFVYNHLLFFYIIFFFFFFFQAEDGIRDAQDSRGLGDVYKRQDYQGISV